MEIPELDPSTVKAWICEKTTRLHFLMPTTHGIFALSLLESFVQCHLLPELKGFAAQRLLTSNNSFEADGSAAAQLQR